MGTIDMAGSLKTVIPAGSPGSDLFGRPPGKVVRCSGCDRNAEEYEAGRCWLCCHAGDRSADPPAGPQSRISPDPANHPGIDPPPGWTLADWLAHLDELGGRANARVCVRTGRPVGEPAVSAPADHATGPAVCRWCGATADRPPGVGNRSRPLPAGWVRRWLGGYGTGHRACCPTCWADAPGRGKRTDLAGRAG